MRETKWTRPRRIARRGVRFGSPGAIREASRDLWGAGWRDRLAQDARYAVRQLSRRPLTTVVVVGTLALGIGANTAMFTFLDVALFRAAPVADPDRLAWIVSQNERGRFENVSYPNYAAFRDRVSEFSGVLAFTHREVSLGGATAERVWSQIVSANAFDVLGVRAELGRTFTPTDDQPGAPLVALLSDGLWRRRYGADPAIVGAPVVVNGRSFAVIGVAPAGFNGPELLEDEAIGLWLPVSSVAVAMPGEGAGLLKDAGANWLHVIGRLAPGATADRARANVEAVAAALPRPSTERSRFLIEPLHGGLDPSNRRDVAPVLGALAIVPVLVLLVACANVANVLLARGIDRRRELAMRRALGATRARLVRQLLTEYVMLALPAAAAAVAVSYLLIGAIVRISHMPASMAVVLTPDTRVLAATTGLAVVAVLVFGLAPALAASRPALTPALKDEGVSIAIASRRHRLRDAFLVGQVTISMVLVGLAGLFLGSLSKVIRVDPGFETRHALTMSVDLTLQGYSRDAQTSFIGSALESVTAVPGVEHAAFTTVLPLAGRFYGTDVSREGESHDATAIATGFAAVSPGYFDVMQMPIVAGRAPSSRDDRSAPAVAIVNETLAARLWPGEPPIGRRLRLGGPTERLREVIGVVRDSKDQTTSPRRRARSRTCRSRRIRKGMCRWSCEPRATSARSGGPCRTPCSASMRTCLSSMPGRSTRFSPATSTSAARRRCPSACSACSPCCWRRWGCTASRRTTSRCGPGNRHPHVARRAAAAGRAPVRPARARAVADRCGRRDGHQPRGVTHLRGVSLRPRRARRPHACVERGRADARRAARMLPAGPARDPR